MIQFKLVSAMALAVACLAPVAASAQSAQSAQSDTAKGIERYRELLADGNPAELWEARGEGLWKETRGPKKASLEACDLGKGPGVVKGAYAELPRHFKDTDRVMDLESRLLHCMTGIQGLDGAAIKRAAFGAGTNRSDMEALVAYVTSESKGIRMKVPGSHPKEKQAYAMGEKIFFYRGGTHDFACLTCHGESNKRIRLQDLPNLLERKNAQSAYTTWPAYRVSQGELRTFQWRLYDCFRQQRFPALEYGSEASIALTAFLAKNANGAKLNAPAIKR